jgi:glycine oxidase
MRVGVHLDDYLAVADGRCAHRRQRLAKRDGVDLRAQLAGGICEVFGVGDRPQDAHTARARCQHRADIARVDSTDREERNAGVARRVPHELGTDGGPAELGGRLVDGSHSYVVDRLLASCVDLAVRVGGEPEEHLRPDEITHLRGRHVLLADMDAISLRGERNLRPIVDDRQRAMAAADLNRLTRDRQQLALRDLLLAQLEDVDAARDRSREYVCQRPAAGASIADQVEPSSGQAAAAVFACGGGFCGCRCHALKSSTRAPQSAGASIRAMPSGLRHDVDIAVLGGGVIGLACAWRARQLGHSVLVIERDRLGCGASQVAAGMLAPVCEAEFGPAAQAVLEMNLRSARMWPKFAAELSQESGIEVLLHCSGTLMLARDSDEARELERQSELRERLRLQTRRLRGSQARELEPALAPGVRLALEAPEDHSVDPRTVLGALTGACEHAGAQLLEAAGEAAVEIDDEGAVSGLRLQDGSTVHAGTVVLAAGAWSGAVEGLSGAGLPEVRPVKGQILRLRDPAGPGLVTRVLRYEGGYIVPRGDGRYVLGATVEEQGFDASPTAGGVYELLKQAWELVPGITELAIEEIGVSFRPGTPDNVPLIGPAGPAGLIWATGHYRNGILLAPLTAELVCRSLTGAVAA